MMNGLVFDSLRGYKKALMQSIKAFLFSELSLPVVEED